MDAHPEILAALRASHREALVAKHAAAVAAMRFNLRLAEAQLELLVPDGQVIDIVSGKIVSMPQRGAP